MIDCGGYLESKDEIPEPQAFTVIKFWMDETSGIALALRTSVPSYQVEDGENRIHLLINLPIALKGERDKALYRDLQTGHKIKIEIHD
jgi:hypothetical protein